MSFPEQGTQRKIDSMKSSGKSSVGQRAARLLADRTEWLGFLERRLGNRQDAEDVLQSSLLKALGKVALVRTDESVVAWFYRVLRRAVIDHHRARAADQRRSRALAADMKAAGEDMALPQSGDSLALCACLLPRIKSLPVSYAEMLWAIDIERRPMAEVAKERRRTVATLHVTLHRARKALRLELQQFCGACADSKCLDCNCQPKTL